MVLVISLVLLSFIDEQLSWLPRRKLCLNDGMTQERQNSANHGSIHNRTTSENRAVGIALALLAATGP